MASKEQDNKRGLKTKKLSGMLKGVMETIADANVEKTEGTTTEPSTPASSARSNNEAAPPFGPSAAKWKNLQSKLLVGAELRAPLPPTIEVNGLGPMTPTPPRLNLPSSRPPSAHSTKTSRSGSYSSRPSSRLRNRPMSAYVTPPPKPPVKEKYINIKDRFGITMEELEPVGMEKMNCFKYIHILFKIWEPQLSKSYRPSAVYSPPPKRRRSRRHHDRYHGGLAAFLSAGHLHRKYSTSSVKSTDTQRSDGGLSGVH